MQVIYKYLRQYNQTLGSLIAPRSWVQIYHLTTAFLCGVWIFSPCLCGQHVQLVVLG